MPVIEAKLIQGVFNESQKKELIRKLTDAVTSIEGEGLREYTHVLISEVASGDWGIGGQPMTTAAVKAVAERPKAKAG